MKISVTILGSGNSYGVPGIACSCPVCLSTNEKNKRLRPSCLLQVDGKKFLIDASPDLRQCFLKYGINSIDGLFLTHAHDDHVGGLNELRPFYFMADKKPMNLYCSSQTWEEVQKRFGFLIERFNPILHDDEIGSRDGFSYFHYFQESTKVTGYRFGDFAYVTDIKEYEDSIFDALKGVKVLVVGAIHERGTPMHFSIKEAEQFAARSGAKETFLTHISHEIEHEKISNSLSAGVKLAYDGMVKDV